MACTDSLGDFYYVQGGVSVSGANGAIAGPLYKIGAPDARKTPLNSHPRRVALGCSPSHPRPGGVSASSLWSSHPPDLLSHDVGLWPSASSRTCCRRAPRAPDPPPDGALGTARHAPWT